MIKSIAIALLLSAPGDTLIRSNVGKLIPNRGAEDLALIFSVNFDALATGCRMGPTIIDGDTYDHNRGGAKQCLINGTFTTCAVGEYCVNENGINLESGTNNILRSDELDVAPWAKTNAAVVITANQCTGPVGLTMEQIDNTAATATDGMTQTPTTGNSDQQGFFAWVRSTTGTTNATLRITHPTATAMSVGWCYRSDAVACSVTLGPGAVCRATTSVTTTPVLVTLKCQATGGTPLTTTPTFQVIPGDFATTSSTLCAGSTMNTSVTTPLPSYTPTTTTSALTDIPSVSRLTLARGPRTVNGTFCITARHWQPIPTNNFSFLGGLLQSGTSGAADSILFDGGPNADVRANVRDAGNVLTTLSWPALAVGVQTVSQVYALSASAGTHTLKRDGVTLTKTPSGGEPRVLPTIAGDGTVRIIDTAGVTPVGTTSSLSATYKVCR